MTTDWCATNSGVDSNSKEASSNAMDTSFNYGVCDVACELTLSFRTLGTIAVFLSIKQYRDELFDYRTLFRRLWSRLKKPFRHSKSGTVRFNDDELEAVRLIPSGAYLTCLGYVEALRVSSSVSVKNTLRRVSSLGVAFTTHRHAARRWPSTSPLSLTDRCCFDVAITHYL
jgi:hypothetical protein